MLMISPEIEIQTLPKTWKDRLNEAEKRGSFTNEDKELAQKWMTCAVGELANERNIYYLYLPYKGHIQLGCTFAGAVGADSIAEAMVLYDQIRNLPNRED